MLGESVNSVFFMISVVTVSIVQSSSSQSIGSFHWKNLEVHRKIVDSYSIPDNYKFVSNSTLGIYKKAAVSAGGQECAPIGADILHRNGSAVDAAIATMLCEGIASLHSMGLGGGFFMTIYDARTGEADFLDARETAPLSANSTMFDGNATLSLHGGLAVAVPGELMGYWEAHQKYGRLPWKELFKPSIKLCKTGSKVSTYLEMSLKEEESYIRSEPTLAEILINPATNELYKKGDKIKRPQLARFLTKIAYSKNPVDLFYHGEVRDKLVEELTEFGGIITREDFSSYKVNWKEPIQAKIGELTMYTAPPPASGILLTFMMNVLKDLLPVKDENTMWQRIVETFKWAYGQRTKLGDPAFVDIEEVIRNLTSIRYADNIRKTIEDDKTYDDPEHYDAETSNKEDHGTAHISVLAPDGSAVSVTTTINQVLGAKIRSKYSGIIFNDEMDDFGSPNITNGFDLPPSPNNFIKPGKRPFSSMAPTILVDEHKNVQLIVGAAGGSKITTAVASTIILHLWYDYTIKEAIDAQRLHHQLFPMTVQNEKGFPADILEHLQHIGHNITQFSGIGSAVCGIARSHGIITANSDYRREGRTAGF